MARRRSQSGTNSIVSKRCEPPTADHGEAGVLAHPSRATCFAKSTSRKNARSQKQSLDLKRPEDESNPADQAMRAH